MKPLRKGPVDIHIEIRDENNKRIAYAIRTLVLAKKTEGSAIPPGKGAITLRNDVAQSLGGLATPTPNVAKLKKTVEAQIAKKSELDTKIAKSNEPKVSELLKESIKIYAKADKKRKELGLTSADDELLDEAKQHLKDLPDETTKLPELQSSPLILSLRKKFQPGGEWAFPSTISDVKSLDDALGKVNLGTPFQSFCGQDGQCNQLAKRLLTLLHTRRTSFVQELREAKEGVDIRNTEVKKAINDVFIENGNQTSLAKRLKSLDDLIKGNSNITRKILTDTKSKLHEFEIVLDGSPQEDGVIDKLEKELGDLDPSDVAAVSLIIKKWVDSLNERRAVNNTSSGSASSGTSIGDILQQQSGDGSLSSVNIRDLAALFNQNSALLQQVLTALKPSEREQLIDRLRRFRYTASDEPRVWVFRKRARPFGWNAPSDAPATSSTKKGDPQTVATFPPEHIDPQLNLKTENSGRLFLDGEFKLTVPGSVIAIQKSDALEPKAFRIAGSKYYPRTDYGISNSTTQVDLSDQDEWWTPNASQIQFEIKLEDADVTAMDAGKLTVTINNAFKANERPLSVHLIVNVECPNSHWTIADLSSTYSIQRKSDSDFIVRDVTDGFATLRTTQVWCDAESLALAEERLVDDPVKRVVPMGGRPATIELDSFYPDLTTQSTILMRAVEREKDDTVGEVFQTAVSQLVGVTHALTKVNGDFVYQDRFHTTIELARPLTKQYWREKFRIFANVVEATHGESVIEVLGGGDATKPHQRFALQTGPLTRLPAATASGDRKELSVRVNHVQWDERHDFVDAGPANEDYVVSTQRDGSTRLQFGNGKRGARVPTGSENVRARYRSGLGQHGNVGPDRVDQLPSPPLGVIAVANPMRASGGADADDSTQTRLRAGSASSFLDRLVSVEDYRAFALAFAGIEKALTRSDAGGIIVTVAGQIADPLDRNGRLLRNLEVAFRQIGSPRVPVYVHPHRPLLLFISAVVQIDSRYEWEVIEPIIRTQMYRRFGFRQRDLAEDVLRADILSTIQSVEGVIYVDLNKFDGIEDDKGFFGTDDASAGGADQDAASSDASGEQGTRTLTRIVVPDRGRFRSSAPNNSQESQESAFVCYLDPAAPDTLLLEVAR